MSDGIVKVQCIKCGFLTRNIYGGVCDDCLNDMYAPQLPDNLQRLKIKLRKTHCENKKATNEEVGLVGIRR